MIDIFMMKERTLNSEITELIDNNELSGIERQYLLGTQRSLRGGDDFRKSVDNLNRKPLMLENGRGIELTPGVKDLSNKLLKYYGDPNIVFRGFGQVGSWGRRDDRKASDMTIWEQLKGWSGNFLFLLSIFPFLFFVEPLIEENLGQGELEIFAVIAGVLIIPILLFTGSLRSKK